MPPFLPLKITSSSACCCFVARASKESRPVPLPWKKWPGQSAAKATRVPLRTTPSDWPFSISKPKAAEHHSWSGSPSGPSQHGHIILQLQSSVLLPEICHAISSSYLACRLAHEL